jgi:hypothetical protein
MTHQFSKLSNPRSEEEIDEERKQKQEEKSAWRAKLRPTASCIEMIVKYLSRIRFVVITITLGYIPD